MVMMVSLYDLGYRARTRESPGGTRHCRLGRDKLQFGIVQIRTRLRIVQVRKSSRFGSQQCGRAV